MNKGTDDESLAFDSAAAEYEGAIRQRIPIADPQHPTLYHYTDAGGLAGILESRRFHATHYQYLNDLDEMKCGERVVKEAAEHLALSATGFKKEILSAFVENRGGRTITQDAKLFVASFSEHGNLLSQWRAYGQDGAGYAVGFRSLTSSEDIALNRCLLYQCIYDEDALRARVQEQMSAVMDALDAVTPGAVCDADLYSLAHVNMLRQTVALVPCLKNRHFREEREWRLVCLVNDSPPIPPLKFKASSDRGVKPYVELQARTKDGLLDIESIVIGPTLDADAACATIEWMIQSYGYSAANTNVHSSGIPYRGEAKKR